VASAIPVHQLYVLSFRYDKIHVSAEISKTPPAIQEIHTWNWLLLVRTGREIVGAGFDWIAEEAIIKGD
jgi:hypothetical protein